MTRENRSYVKSMEIAASRFLNIKRRSLGYAVLMLAVVQLLPPSAARALERRIEPGRKMPEFAATDISGQRFEYKHGRHRATLVAFLSATQERSSEAAADIEKIVARLGAKAEDLDVVIVAHDSNDPSRFQPKQGQLRASYHVLMDKKFAMWGKFGIIALPTVIISDPNDTVSWVNAGHQYNFFPKVDAFLKQALGITQDIPSDPSEVRTASVDRNTVRAMAHLKMGKMFKKKGRLSSALLQMREAQQLDPNSLEVVLELGELLCQMGQAQAALEAVGKAGGSSNQEKARISLVLGWAKRQTGQLEAAEELLLEATRLNPKSSRGLFELGKIYQARGQSDKAIASYRKALAQLLGEDVRVRSADQKQEQRSGHSKSDDAR